LISDGGSPIGIVALSERVDPAGAPHPANESERLLFRQLYETLVHVDCGGRVTAGLGSSWRFDAATGAWIVTLRDNARFSDDSPVTANDVIGSWKIRSDGEALRPEVRSLVRSVVALDDRTLEITLENTQADAPMALGHTDLAVARRSAGSPWPLGTRRASVLPGGRPSNGVSEITVIRLPEDPAPDASNKLPSIRFLISPGRDARDLLDAGADLVVTRDPTALSYAATLSGLVSVPLGWGRTYALAAPRRSREARPLAAEERQALAHDAVRGEARGSAMTFGGEALANCGLASPQPNASTVSLTPRVVYDGNDNAARDLAERLVGLARASGPGATAVLDALLPDRPNRNYQRATGLTGAALATARRSGSDAAYILAVEPQPLDPCREMKVLVNLMGWIDPQTMVPLVDTRMRAIVRRGRSGATVDWDGGLLLADGPPKK
jgi:hypothetical protein